MIPKEQYVEIIDLVQDYISKYKEVFPDKPLSDDFCSGVLKVVDLIKSLVKSK